jgi:hypothetical protein
MRSVDRIIVFAHVAAIVAAATACAVSPFDDPTQGAVFEGGKEVTGAPAPGDSTFSAARYCR